MAQDYNKLIPALKERLPAQALDALGRTVGFIKRLREVTASLFVFSVVLSRFGLGRPGFEEARRWFSRLGGPSLFPRPFQMRFKAKAAVSLFEKAFDQAVAPWRSPTRPRPCHPLARKFPDVICWDSTGAQVADSLRKHFKGTRSAKAALKIVLGISLFGLLPLYAGIYPGNVHDMLLFPPLCLFQAGTLFLFDKGFVAYERLQEIADAKQHSLCPMRQNGNPGVVGVHRAPAWVKKRLSQNPEGVRLRDLLPRGKRLNKPWDLYVRVLPKTQSIRSAKRSWILTRLVITPGRRVAQHPYLTNLSIVKWPASAVRELYRLRWQVELVIKELKQHVNLEVLPTKDPHAVQCFAWASLIALAVSRLLGHALVVSARRARAVLQLLAENILDELRALHTQREDSFLRLVPLLSDGGRA